MKKMLFTLLTVVMVLTTLAVPAFAEPPTTVSGTFDYTFELLEDPRQANGNVFLHAQEWETWEGSFSGDSIAEFWVTQFREGNMNVWLRSEFTGTVLGVGAGDGDKMVIQLVGKKPAGEDWYGQWVIVGGEGDLAQVRGRGTWGGPGFGAVGPDIWYSGQIHFEP
jgi:hypothetical protein